jgi:hypothetical protein
MVETANVETRSIKELQLSFYHIFHLSDIHLSTPCIPLPPSVPISHPRNPKLPFPLPLSLSPPLRRQRLSTNSPHLVWPKRYSSLVNPIIRRQIARLLLSLRVKHHPLSRPATRRDPRPFTSSAICIPHVRRAVCARSTSRADRRALLS